MKKHFLSLATLIFFFMSVLSHSHMGEKHQEKVKNEKEMHHEKMGGEMGVHGEKKSEEMEEHHEKMEVLHQSMEILGGHAGKILNSLIDSDFSGLGESARAVREIAGGLYGTKPHKNVDKIAEYEGLIETFKKESQDFERAVNRGEPVKIAQGFGKVVEVCVACHVGFRD